MAVAMTVLRTLARQLTEPDEILRRLNDELVAQNPAKATELRDRLHAWRESVGAALPKPNPDFQPPKAK